MSSTTPKRAKRVKRIKRIKLGTTHPLVLSARVRRLVVTGSAVAVCAGASVTAPRDARAQAVDVQRPLPNVMVLLDTSGSMERMTTGKDPVCNDGVNSDKNRWGAAVEALTGTVADSSGAEKYSCYEMSRNPADTTNKGNVFATEYKHNGSSPYDLNYYLPFHRPASGKCVYSPAFAPGVATTSTTGGGGSVLDFPVGSSKPAISTRDYTAALPQMSGLAPTVDGCTFNQFGNGMLDSASDLIRFGLMTFDSDTGAGTGATGFGSSVLVSPTSTAGTWSYFFNWDNGGTAATGKPANCGDNPVPFVEIGARNPAAPPWEGRLIGLPIDPDATIATVQANTQKIQLAVNAMRPWGATPIAGMVKDARTYFWEDSAGPKADPYVTGGCRKEYIILITDGAPNLDLRPSCAATPASPLGVCPYAKTEDTVADLYKANGGTQVTTYVVGFAVSDAADVPVQCSDVVLANGSLDTTQCTAGSKYATCCELERIALAGSGGAKSAFFADDPAALASKLEAVIADITAKTTTRTVPAYSPVVADVPDATTNANASLFLASLFPTPSKPWAGNITRQRYVCDPKTYSLPSTGPVSLTTAGDNFSANLNSHTGRARQFLTVQPTGTSTSSATLRPQSSQGPSPAVAADGLATGTATVALGSESAAMANLSPTSLGVTPYSGDTTKASNAQCANLTNTQRLALADCKELALRFTFGSSGGPAGLNATFRTFESRYNNAFGDIFHASPAVIGTPDALIRDESYQAFRTTWASIATPTTPAKRPVVMYAATNDGLLHAFDTSVSTLASNEIWAFLPPAVMPQILSTYPATHALLLDGAPVVKDTVYDRIATGIGGTNWHSTLVASYGTQGRGFYALDVTDPDPTNSKGTGPKFLWQITGMPAETSPVGPARQLFGTRSGTPAITTVFIDITSGATTTKHEVGVAILPGGMEGAADSSCATPDTTHRIRAAADIDPATNLAMPKPGYIPRAKVRCWPSAGRSLSIVRLDNGEILRTFVLDPTKDAPSALSATRVTAAPIYAPLVGTPLVYPGTVGSVAQRVYVGDAEGTVLRFDLSSTDPSKWRGDIFFDTAYTETADAGQPIAVPPVLALDRGGRVVIAVATGDQETLTSTGTNWVWSLSETLSAEPIPRLRATPNWFLKFDNGKRVTGPTAIFDGTYYFATFTPEAGTAKCGGGSPEIYGRDFVTADGGVLAAGGIPRFNPDSVATIPGSITPADSAGKLIPGVTVNIPPTCAKTDVLTNDPYIPGAQHYSATNVSSSAPKLTYQFAGVKGNADAEKKEYNLRQPFIATTVDSWASVVE